MEYFQRYQNTNIKKEICGDTVFFDFGNNIKTALRPSGTEPYLKLYQIFRADDLREAREKENIISDFFCPIIHRFYT